jgi:acyl-CoA thioesterase-1
LAEVPYSYIPAFSATVRSRLYIFADSVTAGMGENTTTTWPAILARSHAIEVQDYSQMGAKVASMARKAEGLSLGEGIVLLEIGGNDVLGGTPEGDFERDLEKLLGTLAGERRNTVMFELPLPPFYNEFGRVQRRLAAKYSVQLIPKSVFVGVLTADGATVDSVHLSRHGHELMAETIWNIIRSAYND